ncbi:hypothetical protein QFZ79_001197 [Arthrobacter sp. V4I6]|nr:hypothetical protein [Arthrobacter sp. V4I6]
MCRDPGQEGRRQVFTKSEPPEPGSQFQGAQTEQSGRHGVPWHPEQLVEGQVRYAVHPVHERGHELAERGAVPAQPGGGPFQGAVCQGCTAAVER